MTKVIIIEDEAPAMEWLSQLLVASDEAVKILAKLRSVKEGCAYFEKFSEPADLIFSDVQLADGLSFDIFRKTALSTPVIFTTSFDQFMLRAFENNGIDYILKPIEESDVRKALWKYKSLQLHFNKNIQDESLAQLANFIAGGRRSRMLVKRGVEHILLRLEDVVLFYTENKVVYVADRFSKKYVLDKTLSELEEELDSQVFFRANRKYIVNLNYIRGFKPFEKVKLLLDIDFPEAKHSIIVSQETAQSFRRWMREA